MLQDEKRVRISAVPADAQAVFLMASFNNWSTTATPMTAVDFGVWEALVPSGISDLDHMRLFVFEPGSRVGRMTVPVNRFDGKNVAVNGMDDRIARPCRIEVVRGSSMPALR